MLMEFEVQWLKRCGIAQGYPLWELQKKIEIYILTSR